MTEHDRFRDSAAAYLLGALPRDELAAYEAHLAGCAACREEVELLAPAAEALPASVEPMAPPPELKARIMAEVEREAALLAAAGPAADHPADAPERTRRHRSWVPWPLPRLASLAVAAALLVLGVAGGLGLARLADDGAHTVAVQVDAQRAPGAGAELEIDDRGSAMLVAHGLPAPPSGRVYQVWLKRPGHAPEPTSALFAPSSDGSATATVPGAMDGIEQVLVTDEPMGGSKVPTREPLLVASMS
jgi:anti-sigma-K factor RskA